MRTFCAWARAVALVLSVGLCGCNGEDSPSPSGGGGGGASGGQPVEGRGVTKASQLVGIWLALAEGDFEVIEFMEDGKALVGDGSGGITLEYAVRDGGRVDLSAGGLTTVFNITIAGDQMALTSEPNFLFSGGTQRFRKLKPGETITQARKAQADARARAYRDRVAALDAFLKQPNLVLAFAQPNAPSPIALEIKTADSGSFNGKAWHDDKPPHLNEITGQLQMDDRTQAAQIVITFGKRITPPATQPDGGGQISLAVTGDAKNLRVAGMVTQGGGVNYEIVLRSDAALHKQIVGRFDAELARIESLKQPIIAMLKDYAVLRGTMRSQDQRQTWPDTAELVLSRDPASGQFWCEGTMVTGMQRRGELVTNAAAQIVVVNDRAVLHMVCPPAREYELSASGKQLTGMWMPPGYNQGQSASFEVVEALDAKARDAKFESQRRALSTMPSDAVFTGLAHEGSRFGLEMPIPVRLQLTRTGEGQFSGKVEYPSMSTLMTVAGSVAPTRSGPRLQLTFTGADATPPDKIFFSSIQAGMWSFAPVDSKSGADAKQLVGHFTGPPLHTTVLTQATDASVAELRKAFSDALAADGRFHLARYVGWQQTGQTPAVVEWKLADGDKVTGKVLTNPRLLGGNEQIAPVYDGTIEQDNGWVKLKLQQTVQIRPGDGFVREYELYVARDAAGVLHCSGAALDLGRVSNGSRMSTAPLAWEHPSDFVPVAATDATTQQAIASAIGAVEKSAADAEAARVAQQQAALDARRTKLAPYFGAFRGPHGAVLMTDLPAEMSAVILDATVDEANATITGKGVDLREMPLREFTFDGGLDNYGQLTVTTSIYKTPLAFNAASDAGATGRGTKLSVLSAEERAKLDALITLAKRLQSVAPQPLSVETLDAAAAKAREKDLAAVTMPGIAIYKGRRNDQVAAMFTAQSNGRYRWTKEPVLMRLNEPMTGTALYIKGGGPTDNLAVIINGVHKATIPAIAQLGSAIVKLPPGLEILDLRLEAEGTAQARGVVLVK